MAADPAELVADAIGNGGPPETDDGGWKRDARGREYTAARGRSGVVYRQGEETIDAALERDAKGPRDQRPNKRRSKPLQGKKPAPAAQDLKTIEAVLAEALAAPAVVCAMAGDQWSADHFTRHAPIVARNLVVASTHNEWLRAKLEAAAAGGQEMLMMKVLSLAGLAGVLVGYAAPPIIYWLNLPVPGKARDLLGIPDRREDAASSPPPAHPGA